MGVRRRTGCNHQHRGYRGHREGAQPPVERFQRIGVEVIDHRHAQAAGEGPADAGADRRPVGIEGVRPQVERQRQADEREQHRRERAPARPLSSERPGEQHVEHRRGLEHEQRQRRRDARHRRVQAIALRRDEQAGDERAAAQLARNGKRNVLQAHHDEEQQRGERRAHAHRRRHARAMIEGDARAEMVRGEGAGDAEQDQHAGAGR